MTSPTTRWPRWIRHLGLAAALAAVLAVGCAKFDGAAPAQTAEAAKAASTYEVLVEEREEAADEATAGEAVAELRAEIPIQNSMGAMAAASPMPMPEPTPAKAPDEIAGFELSGVGGGGTIEKVRLGKRKRMAKPKPMAPEMRKRQARAVVSKKMIAGAFMQAGSDARLFAEGGQEGDIVTGGKFGDKDADDGGAVAPLAQVARRPAKRPAGKAESKDNKESYKGKDGWTEDEEAVDLPEEPRPDTFLPRMCYFENTYLGGNAAYLERLRRLDEAFQGNDRNYRRAKSVVADVDPPAVHGLALTATLSQRSFAHAGRVFLQVGLRGSLRYGWRRPPLDIAVVVDQPALTATRDGVSEILLRLVRDLGAQDRVTIHVVGGGPEPFLAATPANQLRYRIAEKVDALQPGSNSGPNALGATIALAGASLAKMSGAAHRIPGAQIALLLVDGRRVERVAAARDAAHRLTLQGAVTSVMAVGGRNETPNHGWWQVANAGHGSYRMVAPGGEIAAVRAELDALARVVARLIRVNVRLGPHTHAIRVIGSKVLGQREVKRVKAREKVVDQKLSETMGVEADRGDDDDGVQTVIPYFLGGDSHVVLIELWVDEPGHIADVELRYKDLVTLDNATARSSVALPRFGGKDGRIERQVRQAVQSAEVAGVMKQAMNSMEQDNTGAAAATLRAGQRKVGGQQSAILGDFATQIEKNRNASRRKRALLNEALGVASERQMGDAGL